MSRAHGDGDGPIEHDAGELVYDWNTVEAENRTDGRRIQFDDDHCWVSCCRSTSAMIWLTCSANGLLTPRAKWSQNKRPVPRA